MKFPFVENSLSVFSRTARQSDGSPKPAENAETTAKALVAGGDPALRRAESEEGRVHPQGSQEDRRLAQALGSGDARAANRSPSIVTARESTRPSGRGEKNQG